MGNIDFATVVKNNEVNQNLFMLIRSVFPSFDRSLINNLLEKAILESVPSGTKIINYGTKIEYIPLIISGKIKLLKEDENGNELLLYHLKSGSSCAITIVSCIKGIRSIVTATTIEDSKLILIPEVLFSKWKKEYHALQNFVFDMLLLRMVELTTAIDSIAFKPLNERLLCYLKTIAENDNNRNLTITHQTIADDFNTRREVISRELKRLEKTQKIILSRNRIELLAL